MACNVTSHKYKRIRIASSSSECTDVANSMLQELDLTFNSMGNIKVGGIKLTPGLLIRRKLPSPK